MGEKIVYNKLVRGRIPEIIAQNGEVAETRKLDDVEFFEALLSKLHEETSEFVDAGSEGELGELADMQEVIDTLTLAAGYTLAERARAQRKKYEERGGFEEKVFLISTETKESAQHTTRATYDSSAPALAEYFKGIGSRVEDVERALVLYGPSAHIAAFELGCGDGRDGVEIAKRVATYKGIDYSAGMIAVAHDTNSDLDFMADDMLTAEFPPNQDIIFAFASILHLDREDLKTVLDKCFASLNVGGILYISTKFKPEYTAEWKCDKFGERLFYFYNPDELKKLVNPAFQEVYSDMQVLGETEWFTQAFRKSANVHAGKKWGEL